MAQQADSDISTVDPQQRERAARRAAARRERLRRRRQAALVVVALGIIALVVALASSGGSSHKGHTGSKSAAARKKSIVPGGPVAPAAFGGLAALWAPANVVGSQPGTAAAYEAASTRTGLPGYLMIADRGNNRILVVDPQRSDRLPLPGSRTTAGKLFFDDDTFIEPGGEYVISNEEDNHAIVQVSLQDRSQTVLFGHPGVPGSDSTHLNTPDDAYMLPDGTFTVADAVNCRVLFIRAHSIVRSYGQAGICRHDPPRYLGPVNGDTPVPGRRRDGQRDRRQLDRRNRPGRTAALGGAGARQLPLRPSAATGRAGPARRLREPRPRPDHRPARAGCCGVTAARGAAAGSTTPRWRCRCPTATSPSTTTTATA